MTTRTARAVSRIFPRRCIGIGGVATDASQTQSGVVVAWILTGRVGESQRCPCRSCMTHIAIARSGHMPGGLARGRSAVVACRTATGDTGVTEGCRFPRQSRVTDIAGLRGHNVRHRFAGCCGAVVASGTGACLYSRMIEQCRRPGSR